MALTVGEVASLASVSVRTLHHYDEIGLLTPSLRSEAGYRLYSDTDVADLQQVLFFRELGFPLGEIAGIMHAPTYDRVEALRMQRRMLMDKAAQLQLMVEAVDAAIGAEEGGITLDAQNRLEVFGEFDPGQYEEEARQRWGDTDAYKVSTARAKRYTKEDWARYQAEADANLEAIVALFDEGVAPTDERAMDAADQARLLIDSWFYPLTREGHTYLGEMYVADPRFTAYYDKRREGLAVWFRDAIKANSERAE